MKYLFEKKKDFDANLKSESSQVDVFGLVCN